MKVSFPCSIEFVFKRFLYLEVGWSWSWASDGVAKGRRCAGDDQAMPPLNSSEFRVQS